MANQPSPHRQQAAQTEAVLLMQQENAYLKQRTVALHTRVLELTAEVERLSALVPAPETEEESG